MNRRTWIAGFCAAAAAGARPHAQDRLRLHSEEAEAVLDFLAGKPGWERLWATEGYVRLKKRDTSMGRPFTDSDFETFLRSEELKQRQPALTTALAAWKSTDFAALAKRIRGYLPRTAKIDATVYIMIKPRTNSFVWELNTNPAIFLYLDPAETAKKFANTVAHELHHVGLASLGEKAGGDAPGIRWMGAFGEGLAMLAAAGGPEVHPHLDSPAEDRARWDRDVASAPQDLQRVERFLLDAIGGKLDKKKESETAMSFFGETQGPWYTLGWIMGVAVEKAKGRKALIDCMVDMRRLPVVYNEIARGADAGQPKWSPELIASLSGRGGGSGSGH